MSEKLRILILHRHSFISNNSINLQAFSIYGNEHMFYYHDMNSPLLNEIKEFKWDAIILSFCALGMRHLPTLESIKTAYDFVRESNAVKVAFPQDDYIRYKILDDWLSDWKFDLVFTPMEKHINFLYAKTRKIAKIHSCYTGYVDDRRDPLLQTFAVPFKKRTVQFGNRINKLPPTYGRHGMLKGVMNEQFQKKLLSRGINCDVSTSHEDRHYDDDWYRFLGNIQFTLAAKGGVSVADPDGEIHKKVAEFKAKNPEAGFEEVEEACFPGVDGKYKFDAIGPRILQASQMGVCQILPKDNYPGGLLAGVDYIKIDINLENSDAVIDKIYDVEACNKIAQSAKAKILKTQSLTYTGFMKKLYDEIKRTHSQKIEPSSSSSYLVEYKRNAERSSFVEKMSLNTKVQTKVFEIAPPYVSALTKRLLNALNKEGINRCISVIMSAEKIQKQHTLLSLEALGYNIGTFTNAEKNTILSYFSLHEDYDRAALKGFLYQSLNNKYPAMLRTDYSHNILIEGDTFKDFTFNRDDGQSYKPTNKLKSAPNKSMRGYQYDLLKELDSFHIYKGKKTPRRTVLCLIDDGFNGHPQYFINKLYNSSKNDNIIVNPKVDRSLDEFDLGDFDAIYIDYSILLNLDHFCSQKVKFKLSTFKGPIIRALQDEYRWVKDAVQSMKDINVDLLISSMLPENIAKVYGKDFLQNVIAVQSPPGFLHPGIIPDKITPLAERETLISGRTWDQLNFKPQYGKFMRKKQELAMALKIAGEELGANVDISQNSSDRVYEQQWGETLMGSRAHLALEGGSSMFDLYSKFDDLNKNYVAENPYADYDEIYENVFQSYENNIVHKVMTPRCIEAAAVGTVIVGMQGNYSGFLEAGKDYIVIADDGSNAKDVLEQLTNIDHITKIAANAKRKIGNNKDLTYEAHVGRLDILIDSFFDNKPIIRPKKTAKTFRAPTPVKAAKRGSVAKKTKSVVKAVSKQKSDALAPKTVKSSNAVTKKAPSKAVAKKASSKAEAKTAPSKATTKTAPSKTAAKTTTKKLAVPKKRAKV